MELKYDASVEWWPSYGVNYLMQMSIQCGWNAMQALNSGPPMGSIILFRCRANACKIQYKRWIVTRLWGQVQYLTEMSLQCMQNTMHALNSDPPMGSIILPRCRSNAWKIQCKRWIATFLWGQLSYPDVAPMRVKYNASVEQWPSHGVNYLIQMTIQCVKNTIQALNSDPPMGSIVLARCRSSACKIQCKR